jgi:UDPglucose 6-dehydrogenase
MTDFIKIGFIGQGWIGRNYADDFEKRGYTSVRYALEPQYAGNKDKIKDCDVVFIAVPTPTTPAGFDASVVESSLALVGTGKIAVIKSTILPGTTIRLQQKYSGITVVYAPEFLSEATAAHDAANPFSNIVGLPVDDRAHHSAADTILNVLPHAPFTLVCSSTEAELIKYSHNLNGYFQIILSNILYDASRQLGAQWQTVQSALEHDPYISNRYSKPVHKTGRGAGGGCFIKDFAAFRELYGRLRPDDTRGQQVLAALEAKNLDLLGASGKDAALVHGVYGIEPVVPELAYRLLPPLRRAEWAIVVAGAAVAVVGALDIILNLAGILR